MADREQQLRERAYHIWEKEGRKDGFELDHWQKAELQHEETEREADAELAAEKTATANGSKGKPSSAPS